MIYINKKNLYIRVILALVIIASVWISFQGGIDFVNAKASASDVPEPYDATNPLTKKALQQHVSATALNNNYTVEYNKTVRTKDFIIEEHNRLIELSNVNTVGYKSERHRGESVDNNYEEMYENSEKLYTNTNGEITTKDVESDGYKSPVVKNQFVNAGYGLNNFDVFTWTVTEVTEDKIVYDLARADAVAVPELSTIDSAEGQIVINRDEQYIEDIQVYLTGSSKEYPTDTVSVNYTYTVDSGNTDVSQPEWVPTTSATEETA